MIQFSTLACVFVLAAGGTVALGQNLVLDFSANPGATVSFGGASHSFNFNPGTNGFQWDITSENGGTSAVGLNGSFLGGPWTYGSISTINVGPISYQTAAVTGPAANLSIFDGTGYLTGSINFMDVETFGPSIGSLNGGLNINLTGINYSGSNPDLLTLKAEQPAVLDLSFQFIPGETLTQLSTGSGPYTTSFSGSVAASGNAVPAPEPASLSLAILGGFAALIGAVRCRK